jgi:type IV pilus assembly protein PilV
MKTKFCAQGFTLLELLVALTIFSVGLLAIAGMSVTSIRGNNQAATLTDATFLAQGIMEAIQARDSSDPLFTAPLPEDEDWPLTGSRFSASFTITAHPNPDVNSVLQITVRVSGPRNVTLISFKGLV